MITTNFNTDYLQMVALHNVSFFPYTLLSELFIINKNYQVKT